MGIHKLRALEYLVAAADHGSFAAAARHLGVSTPSVHRLVSALEREAGVALLHRDGAVLRPTRDAQAYVDRARRLVMEFAELESGLRDTTRAPSGTVVVACQSVVTRFVLADALPEFHAAYPEIAIDLRDAGSSRDLVHLEADVLLQFGWPPPQDAIARTLAYTRWLVVASPAYWARHGVPAHPAELARHPCALFRTPYGEVIDRWAFARGGERVEVKVEGWLTGDDRGALDAPVLAGQMVARVNDLTARQELASGRLQPVLLDWEGQHSPPLTMLVRKSLTRQPRVRAFADFMRGVAESKASDRLPRGLPAVAVPTRPDWFRRRVG